MKNVLFIVNGLGLGNSSRSDALIRELSSDFCIDLATSSNGLKYFRTNSLIRSTYSLAGMSFGKADHGISILQFFLQIPSIVFSWLSNLIRLFLILKKCEYQLVVIDSDYTAIFWKWIFDGKIVAINNSVWTKLVDRNLVCDGFQLKIHYYFEKLDYLFHRFIPDLTLCPLLEAPRLQLETPFEAVAPLVRFSKLKKTPQKKNIEVLVIPSASGLGLNQAMISELSELSDVHFHVVGMTGENSNQFSYYGLMTEMSALYERCEIVISNAGWSTICEFSSSHRIGVFIPIQGHTEQMANSELIKHRQDVLIANIYNYKVVLKEAICLAKESKFEVFNSNFLPSAYQIMKSKALLT